MKTLLNIEPPQAEVIESLGFGAFGDPAGRYRLACTEARVTPLWEVTT